jgi:guanylate kinase
MPPGSGPCLPASSGSRARLTVLSGPSGVGKTTVAARLRKADLQLWMSVSVTTRRPRPGEVEGRDYYFVDDREFDRMLAAGELLEWAPYVNLRHGTPRAPVEQKLAAGVPVLLEIDLAGARQVRQAVPDARLVFLAPPSWDELVRRLTGRGTEPPDVIKARLDAAVIELAAEKEFDVTLVNTSVEDVCRELVTLITADLYLYGRRNVAGTPALEGITNPPIDELLGVVDSKYRLVIMAAKRARQINAYYAQLGEGLLEYVGPLVETRVQEKPLSIALREIRERLLAAEAIEEPAA